MNTVLFTINNPDHAGQVLRLVKDKLVGGVIDKLFPMSKSPALACQFYLELPENGDVRGAAEVLRTLPDISDVEVPPVRELIG